MGRKEELSDKCSSVGVVLLCGLRVRSHFHSCIRFEGQLVAQADMEGMLFLVGRTLLQRIRNNVLLDFYGVLIFTQLQRWPATWLWKNQRKICGREAGVGCFHYVRDNM